MNCKAPKLRVKIAALRRKGKTWREIGRIVGVSHEAARQAVKAKRSA